MKSKLLAVLMCLVLTMGTLTACGGSTDEADVQASSEEVMAEASSEEVMAEASTEAVTPDETVEADTEAAKTIADYVPGSWEETVYANETLGIKMTFPESYTIYTGDTLKELMGVAVDTATEGTDIQNVSMETMVYDFMAMAPDMIANVIFSVEENTFQYTAEEYSDTLLQSFDFMGIDYEIIKDKETATVGTKDFCVLELLIDYDGTGLEENAATQTYMVHADDNFLYYFIVTASDTTTEELAEIMNSLEPM